MKILFLLKLKNRKAGAHASTGKILRNVGRTSELEITHSNGDRFKLCPLGKRNLCTDAPLLARITVMCAVHLF
jgi:hypothetical protein